MLILEFTIVSFLFSIFFLVSNIIYSLYKISFRYNIAQIQRRQWQPTPVLLPGKSHGWRSLVGCSPRGRWESDTTKWLPTSTFHFHALEKEIATHSSDLAWRIPGTGEPGRLPSMGLHRVGHDWSDVAAAAQIKNPCLRIWRKLSKFIVGCNKHWLRACYIN